MTTGTPVRGDMQDRIRQALLSYGTKEIYCTIDDLIGKTGLQHPQVYQALYRLQNLNELKIIKEDDSPRSPIIGVKLLRMAPEVQVKERITSRSIEIESEKKSRLIESNVPHVLGYIEKKIAVEKAREAVSTAHLDPEEVVVFTPDPLGEEALILLQELTDTKKKLVQSSYDLEAARRDNTYLKQRVGTEVYNDSGT